MQTDETPLTADMSFDEFISVACSYYDKITTFYDGLLKGAQLTPYMRETVEALVADQQKRHKPDFLVEADQIKKLWIKNTVQNSGYRLEYTPGNCLIQDGPHFNLPLPSI